ncbi:alpha/beta fold hydrolase [Pseudoroseomonas cervicalis]|uniref:alpha/beta fold hydrolase n=1 Tax=Teichococcus cervicalis TaxID=204525 RepID=UPI00278648BE|nr:alpha/beta fold hydrolase [Pseudoroseomonas cervicalis]MDQ1081648.1 pimeloyl-ACP methyl ester carboxylesterase [Pseudoroseomonas cervicalis]
MSAAPTQATRPALILLPGLLCDARLWRDAVEGLGDVAEHQVADLTQDDTLRGMALRVLETAPPRFALAGLSMGGYVAFEILRLAPQRVTHLALFDTSARPDSVEAARRRRGLMALSRSGQFRGVTPRLLPSLLHPEAVAGPLGHEVRAMADRVGHDAFLRQQMAILHRPDSRPLLPGITQPSLVAVGEQDALTPPELAEEMAGLIPGAVLARIPHSGHLPTMEQPAACAALLRAWLARG